MNRECVLVTGASGLVGGALLEVLASSDRYALRAAYRAPSRSVLDGVEEIFVQGLEPDSDWSTALCSVDIVVHAAARVHVMKDSSRSPLDEYRRINVEGTLNLARQALAAGVRRFVYISSIKVNGEGTESDCKFSSVSEPSPMDSYGISKWESELSLKKLLSSSEMQLVVIRPVLVYGAGVKANFLTMLDLIRLGVPLPLSNVVNRRSYVGIDNLVDLIVRCLDHPDAAGHVFIASDDEDVSTPELLREISVAMGKPLRVFPMPLWVMFFIGKILGREEILRRVCSSLQVDIDKTKELLGWSPPVSFKQGISKAVNAYLRSQKS